MKNELKPCPFCGRVDNLIIDNAHYRLDDCVIYNYRVCCSAAGYNTGCGASCGYRQTINEAIEAWNRRATDE